MGGRLCRVEAFGLKRRSAGACCMFGSARVHRLMLNAARTTYVHLLCPSGAGAVAHPSTSCAMPKAASLHSWLHSAAPLGPRKVTPGPGRTMPGPSASSTGGVSPRRWLHDVGGRLCPVGAFGVERRHYGCQKIRTRPAFGFVGTWCGNHLLCKRLGFRGFGRDDFGMKYPGVAASSAARAAWVRLVHAAA